MADSTTYLLGLFLKCSIKPGLMSFQSTTSARIKIKAVTYPTKIPPFSASRGTLSILFAPFPIWCYHFTIFPRQWITPWRYQSLPKLGPASKRWNFVLITRRANQQVKCHPKPLFSVCHTDKSWHLVFCLIRFRALWIIINLRPISLPMRLIA